MTTEKDTESPRETAPTSITEKAVNKAVSKILKWVGILLTVLTLAGVLIGYGVWIGGTNHTLQQHKTALKDLKDYDTRTSNSLTKLLSKLTQQLTEFNLVLVRQQDAINSLRQEIRIRHEDPAYISKILQYQAVTPVSYSKLNRVKRRKLHAVTYDKAQKQASIDSDSAMQISRANFPLQEDALEGLSF